MKCSKGVWIFLLLIFLLFLAIPLHIGVLRIRIPPHLAEELFKNFTVKYNKSYSSPEEFQKRLGIFKVSYLHLHSTEYFKHISFQFDVDNARECRSIEHGTEYDSTFWSHALFGLDTGRVRSDTPESEYVAHNWSPIEKYSANAIQECQLHPQFR